MVACLGARGLERSGGVTLTASDERAATPVPQPGRQLVTAGAIAAASAAALGLATLTTVTLIGWIAAPHVAGIGAGLPGVFRAAVQVWLVAHHTGFELPTGRVAMLPLGLVVLPGALLCRAGGAVARAIDGDRLRHAPLAALGLAVPYTIIATLAALIARTDLVQPSLIEAPITSFLLAFIAGLIGAARVVSPSRGFKGFLRLLPDRPRSLVIGSFGAASVLVIAGAVLTGASLAVHAATAATLTADLAPGIVGGILLVLLQIAYLPNAVLWGLAYAVGPGFAVGSGTIVAPTGVIIGTMPTFPMLAAIPAPGAAPAISLISLAAPFAGGIVAGILVVRAAPTPVLEAAPLWGFACGLITGVIAGGLAAFSGGPLGGARMTLVGPSAWQVGLVSALEVGVAAAITAWLCNWLLVRRRVRTAEPGPAAETESTAEPAAVRSAARPDERPAERPDIVDESPSEHRIYVDPFADDPD